MTQNDREPFARILAALAEVFDAPVTPARAELYWNALRDLDLALIRDAADSLIKTADRFPFPASIRSTATLLAQQQRTGEMYIKRLTGPQKDEARDLMRDFLRKARAHAQR
jgi:hypothetical protein